MEVNEDEWMFLFVSSLLILLFIYLLPSQVRSIIFYFSLLLLFSLSNILLLLLTSPFVLYIYFFSVSLLTWCMLGWERGSVCIDSSVWPGAIIFKQYYWYFLFEIHASHVIEVLMLDTHVSKFLIDNKMSQFTTTTHTTIVAGSCSSHLTYFVRSSWLRWGGFEWSTARCVLDSHPAVCLVLSWDRCFIFWLKLYLRIWKFCI